MKPLYLKECRFIIKNQSIQTHKRDANQGARKTSVVIGIYTTISYQPFNV
jgi:hypothetical protein